MHAHTNKNSIAIAYTLLYTHIHQPPTCLYGSRCQASTIRRLSGLASPMLRLCTSVLKYKIPCLCTGIVDCVHYS